MTEARDWKSVALNLYAMLRDVSDCWGIDGVGACSWCGTQVFFETGRACDECELLYCSDCVEAFFKDETECAQCTGLDADGKRRE